MNKICDECETVAHCTKHGCIPKQQALDKMAENARELGLDYEPAPMIRGDIRDGLVDDEPAQQQEQAAQTEPKKDLMWSTVAMQERHDQRIKKVVATLEQIKQEQLAEQPAQQEPVAFDDADIYGFWARNKETERQQKPMAYGKPWVGLTDEEITDIWAEASPYYHEDDFARAIEAKLKEKNT